MAEDKRKKILKPAEAAFIEYLLFDADVDGCLLDAYKKAYPERAAKNTHGTLKIQAIGLKNKKHIQKAIAQIEQAGIKGLECSKESHAAELARIREEARENGNYAVALNAEISRGKVAGHYVERKEITHKRESDLDTLIKLYQTEKELAIKYAKDLGLLKQLSDAIDVDFEVISDELSPVLLEE